MARNPDPARSTGRKRKGSGGSSTKKSKVKNDAKIEDVDIANGIEKYQDLDNHEEPVAHKRPKRAAACANFKEQSVKLSEKSSIIETKVKHRVEEEITALHLTKLGPEDPPPCRKLLDFSFHDADRNLQPFEMSEINDIFITSLIMPLDDNFEKGRGVICDGFGRIENWAISGYDEGTPIVWVSTETADYECVKPAANYRKFYDHFYEKARICIEVYRKLTRSVGGNPNMSYEELLAGVIRSLSGTKSFSGGTISRDFLISHGEFIYKQLIGLDETAENSEESLATLPALLSLRDECNNRSGYGMFPSVVTNGSLRIKEGEDLEGNENDDVRLARLLQEEEDWKMMKKQKGRRPVSSQKNIYIKICESEIANDYPLPSYYKPSVEEMDEFIFFETETSLSYPDLPRRVLDNWALYNSDSRLISLELLPMKPCADIDVTIFGSGSMREDDGCGFCSEFDLGQSSGTSDPMAFEGVPIYLSAIKEWVIEFGSSMIFISIRTDVAWYRLGKPTKQYALWYEPVLKTARLAISIITLLKEQSRVSRLSFTDVIKKISQFEKDQPAHISSNIAVVERYVVVHGQIILQQFSEYPDETIKKSAFVSGLSDKMEQRHHTKLIMKKKVVLQKEANLNPTASVGPLFSKRKIMRATTTKLINRIWGEYYSNYFPEDSKEGGNESKGEEIEEEQEENEEEEVEEENVLLDDNTSKTCSSTRSHIAKTTSKQTRWQGEAAGQMDSGETLYKSARVCGKVISVGGAVMIEPSGLEELPDIFFVEFMFQKHDGTKMVHGRMMQKGSQTVLGNAAKESEVFLTNECTEFELGEIKDSVSIDIRKLPWGYKYRKEHFDADNVEREKVEERKKNGLSVEYYCKSLYWPERGAFFSLPFDSLGLGTGICNSCRHRVVEDDEFKINSKTSLVYKKNEYNLHDYVYARPQSFSGGREEECGTFKAGRSIGLKAYVVCQLLEILVPIGSKQPTAKSTMVKVRRFYRPEDVSTEKAYCSDIREVYYSEDTHTVPVEILEGRCEVCKKGDLPDLDLPVVVDHIFFCEYMYDAAKGSLKQLPANLKLLSMNRKIANTSSKRNKGKGKCIGGEEDGQRMSVPEENRLVTLDIFAGCGGLSEGLETSGATFTKWAIEYEQPAGEAFMQNHPNSLVFIDNCNVILRAIMEKCGDADDCISTTEASELAAGFDKEKLNNLPVPGQVDFINGGPPCQGFSGMNRFNQSTWSKVQCEMILAFLSFAEYFRPRYFLLENVRNFVSFNKGQTFRLTLASLLEMGYQVRYGILDAGAYGVSQSRKRAFIWAAAPGEILPEWPEPMHVFAGHDLKISLDKNVHYAAVRSTAGGAPFRSITVRDTIGDLPTVENGASKDVIQYESHPSSWFQKQIRGNMLNLNDHITKEMNELNLIRCKHIPKRPGSDWHDLPDEKVKLSNGQMVDLIPWCLPNTAKRHNQWKGLFGRLDWEGNFPTSITDPQPMGKVGMCFHPEQDRILTVRECARSQGFPDRYLLYGNIQNKYRQIGNAVPPPLAYALGRKLKEAVEAKHSAAKSVA